MIEPNEHIDTLIARVLTGEASLAEKQELDTWLLEDENHRKYFGQMESLYHVSKGRWNVEGPDVDLAWNKVSQAIQTETRVIPLNTGKTSYKSIAAVAVVLLGITSLVFLFTRNKQADFAMLSNESIVADTLPDGSEVKLNRNSELNYFYEKDKHERRAALKGEGYFHVVHNEAETFVVDAGEVFIRDIGTSFNVIANPGNDTVRVFVREGTVQFYTAENGGLELNGGEEAYYLRSAGRFEKITSPEMQQEPSWADHDFRFRNASMKKVIRKINKVYGDVLMLSNERIADCTITVDFNDADPAFIAEIIAETMHWSVREENGHFVLDGNSCE